MSAMEPIPETVEAAEQLRQWGETGDLVAGLVRLAQRAGAIVPSLVGVSVTRLDDDLTFTVVSSAESASVLDGVQYLFSGPCVDSAATQVPQEFEATDVLDEERWRLFAASSAARGVQATLSLPLAVASGALGSVNLYAGLPRAFDGLHHDLGRIFGAWAEGAVANADLTFASRRAAEETPERIRAITLINEAIGYVAGCYGVDVEEAERRLIDAAARAGVSLAELADTLLRQHEDTLRPTTDLDDGA